MILVYRTAQENKLRDYLLDNTDELRQIANELNSWNGCLDHLDVHENDEDFFNTYFDGNPMEAVRAAHYGSYSYNDDYVRFDGYGNLESLTEGDMERELKDNVDDIIDYLQEHRSHIDLPYDVEEILDEEEEEEERRRRGRRRGRRRR
jgi:hypothetical protein